MFSSASTQSEACLFFCNSAGDGGLPFNIVFPAKDFCPSARKNCRRKGLLFNMVLSVKEMNSLRPWVIFGVSRFLYAILLPFYPGSLRLCV